MIRRVAGLALACAVAALVGSSLAPAFTGQSFVIPVAVTAVVPVALAWACSTRKLSVPISLAVSAVAFVVLAATVVGDPDELALPTPDNLSAVVSGVVRGWSLAVSANIPIPASPEVSVIVVLLTWLTAVLTAEALLRSARPALVIVPAVIAYPVALVVGGGSGAGVVRAAALGAGLLGLLAVSTSARRAGHRVGSPRLSASVRQFGAAAGAAALLGVIVALLVPAFPIARADEPFDPRDLRTPDIRVHPTSNPLAEVKSTLQLMPEKPQFTARVISGGPVKVGARWRVAVLDHYDGRTWSSNATFVPAGRDLPKVADTDRAAPVTEEISIEGLGGAFLPSPGRATMVSATGIGFDDASGMLIALDNDVLGSRYEITADLDPTPLKDALLAAPVGSTSDLERYLQLPTLDGESRKHLDAIRQFARKAGTGGPGAQLRALEALLHDSREYGYDIKNTPPGHSVGALKELLDSKTGYAEQFASLFAVAARQLGLPTRLVVGFQALRAPAADGTFTLTSGDQTVWTESLFEGLGWVTFDPTPFAPDRRLDAPEPPPDVPDGVGGTSGGSTEVVRGPQAVRTTILGAPRGVVLAVAFAFGAIALVGLALVGTIIGLKGLRRRRRQHTAPDAARVVAAWQEAQDRMRDWGVPVVSSQTDRQIVREGTEALGEERARRLGSLASLATSAKFSEEAPARTTSDTAWKEVSAFGADLRSGRSIKERAQAQLNPRSLVGRR